MRRFQYSHGNGAVADGRQRHWTFRPPVSATIATILLLPLLVALGEWQVRRGEEKEALQARSAAQAALPPLRVGTEELQRLRSPAASGRRIVILGHWDSRRQILLDNQTFAGQAGYRIFTPLRLVNGSAVLVNRGWLPGGARRDMAPDVKEAVGEGWVAGIVAPPPAAGYLAHQVVDASLGGHLLRVQQVDIQDLAQRLGLDLEPWTLLLDQAAPDGYLRHQDTPRFAPERHFAYALQWFLLAALLAGFYIGLNLRRR